MHNKYNRTRFVAIYKILTEETLRLTGSRTFINLIMLLEPLQKYCRLGVPNLSNMADQRLYRKKDY